MDSTPSSSSSTKSRAATPPPPPPLTDEPATISEPEAGPADSATPPPPPTDEPAPTAEPEAAPADPATPPGPAVNVLPSTPPQPQDAEIPPSINVIVDYTAVPPPPPLPGQPRAVHRSSTTPTLAPSPPFASRPAPTRASTLAAASATQSVLAPAEPTFVPADVPEILGSRRSSLRAPPPPPKPIFPPPEGPTPPASGPPPRRRNTRSPSPRFSYDAPEAGPSSRPLSVQTHTDRFTPLVMAGPYPATPALTATPSEFLARPPRALNYAETQGRVPRERPDTLRRASNGATLRSPNGNGWSGGVDAAYGHGVPAQDGHYSRRASRRSVFDVNSNGSFATMREKTVEERLKPTLDNAQEELKTYRLRARATGWSLNFAIGAQVVLGALTTGVAAATSGRQTSIATSVLGGMSTLAASYLAKARGSGEPEFSAARVAELEHFVREAQAWCLDNGHRVASEDKAQEDALNAAVARFRERFEEIMGAEPGGLNKMFKGTGA